MSFMTSIAVLIGAIVALIVGVRLRGATDRQERPVWRSHYASLHHPYELPGQDD